MSWKQLLRMFCSSRQNIQDWWILFRNRIYYLHKSGPFTEKRPRKLETSGIKDAISPTEHAFPFVTFRPEKRDYLSWCSRLVPEIFR